MPYTLERTVKELQKIMLTGRGERYSKKLF